LPLQFPDWHLTSEVRHNVFLAFKEALHNAVKHSRASEVLIRLTLKTESFELVIEDNGCGFPVGGTTPEGPAAPGRAAAGNGLGNMRRRLAAIGGSCEIQSAAGEGTRVFLFVSLRASTGDAADG
jgi:signal transduction histidine kinase